MPTPRRLILRFTLPLLVAACGACSSSTPSPPTASLTTAAGASAATTRDLELDLMTFNIRFDNPADGANVWAARRALVAAGTFNGWGKDTSERKIDYILAPPPPATEVRAAAIDRVTPGGRFPSDHDPLTVRLRVPATAARYA